jgi:hypothetical protein
MDFTDNPVKNSIEWIEGISVVEPTDPQDRGYENDDTLFDGNEHVQLSREFRERYNDVINAEDADLKVAVYVVSFTPANRTGRDFRDVYQDVVEELESHDDAHLLHTDRGVPENDWSGWDIDPMMEVVHLDMD